jgi:hypothetical protein
MMRTIFGLLAVLVVLLAVAIYLGHVNVTVHARS